MLLTRLSQVAFAVSMLFAAGEPGANFETYNPDSLLQRTNFVTYSDQFDNAAWTKLNATVTADADGTADKIVPNTTNAQHTISQTGVVVAGAPGVVMTRVKPGGYSWIALQIGGAFVYFDIANGAIGATSNGTGTITPSLDDPGYYDCAVRPTNGVLASSEVTIYVATGSGASGFAGDGVSGIFVRRIQANRNTLVPVTYQKVTDWNTEYLAAAGSRVHMWQDNLRTVPVTAVEQTVGCWDDLSPNGKNATQSTSGSRPKLSARYNLLTKSEQFDDAAWGKATADTSVLANVVANPIDGSVTADKLIEASVTATNHYVFQGATPGIGVPVTLSVYAKAGERNFLWLAGEGIATALAFFNLATGAVGTQSGTAGGRSATITPVTSSPGWYRCTLQWTTTVAVGFNVFVGLGSADNTINYAGTANSGLYVSAADFRTAGDAALNQPAYQRVNTATDYDTAGFIHYLKFDGTDDSFQTPSIDFSGVNKMTVWAGATKLSDAAVCLLAELTAQGSTTDGGFYLAAPGNAASASYSAATRGTVAATAGATANNFAAPTTRMLVTQMDNSGATMAAQLSARIDGSASALTLSGGPTTAGNFANAALNIGRRNNTNLPFNGRMTSLTVRGSTTPTSAAFIKKMEQYAAKLAGQSFVST